MKAMLAVPLSVTFLLSCKKGTDIVVAESANKKPVATVVTDLNITMPQDSAFLDGRGSLDPDGKLINYKWEHADGPSSFVIENPTAPLTTVRKLVPGTYHFQLTVTDNKGARSTAIAKIQVDRLPSVNSYSLDTTIVYTDNTVITDTFWLAAVLTEWGSYRSFNLPSLATVDTSTIRVFRRIEPTAAPWRELSFVPDVYPNMAVPLYGGVYTTRGETITTGIGIIGSASVRVYVRVTAQ